ncbi:MAG TPA: RICIN domain-containing protein [Pseudonocardiaceae bacterium]|jgi:hypothetical protein|nr:RICIN domain-containing protein [Pseudonocardiaceae bacterium]
MFSRFNPFRGLGAATTRRSRARLGAVAAVSAVALATPLSAAASTPASVPAPTAASAAAVGDPVPGGIFRIGNRNGLHSLIAAPESGALAFGSLFDANDNARERWKVLAGPTSGTFLLQNEATKLCMGVAGSSKQHTTAIFQGTCNTNVAGQVWQARSVDPVRPALRKVINPNSGLAWDPFFGMLHPGAPIVTYFDTGDSRQHFIFSKVG